MPTGDPGASLPASTAPSARNPAPSTPTTYRDSDATPFTPAASNLTSTTKLVSLQPKATSSRQSMSSKQKYAGRGAPSETRRPHAASNHSGHTAANQHAPSLTANEEPDITLLKVVEPIQQNQVNSTPATQSLKTQNEFQNTSNTPEERPFTKVTHKNTN